MTTSQKHCPCCSQPVPVQESQCPGCGYDYQTRFAPQQVKIKSAQINSAQTKPALSQNFVPMAFALPRIILPPHVSEEETLWSAGKHSEDQEGWEIHAGVKRRLPILLTSFGALAVLLLVIGGLMIQARRRPPGPEAQALAGHMKPYEFTSERQFTAVFGLPTTRVTKTVQGTPYDFWNYRCSDGAALVTYNIRSQQIERVRAIGRGS